MNVKKQFWMAKRQRFIQRTDQSINIIIEKISSKTKKSISSVSWSCFGLRSQPPIGNNITKVCPNTSTSIYVTYYNKHKLEASSLCTKLLSFKENPCCKKPAVCNCAAILSVVVYKWFDILPNGSNWDICRRSVWINIANASLRASNRSNSPTYTKFYALHPGRSCWRMLHSLSRASRS